ncbi:small ribosomal subunit protein mS31 [Plodia interpunctella]|uniref:small ribosomal subunit protein mS31 n=1 Tax=Plodia interpunctella TaxID=58824 RepID=UPI00236828BC|nr:28S ribosomal protein S31, mitochondrial [Plodia interpunctella]
MLSRIRVRRDFRLIARYFSDKSDGEEKLPQINKKTQDGPKKQEDSTEKIQELLKLMMAQPKVSDNEYSEKFVTAPSIPRRRKQKSDEIEVKTQKIEEDITKAASEVAQAIGGDVKQTEAELLSKVLGKINQNSTSLSDLLIGMKVDRTKESEDDHLKTESRMDRGQQVKRLVNKNRDEASRTRFTQRKERQLPTRERPKPSKSLPQATMINIFSGEPLGIFKANEGNYGTKLEVWDQLKQRELTLATSQPPANYFEKMILWTEQGKVWKFPINNEQGIEEEQNVPFTEHIFLDSHLEGWCPKKGPIRHFMELVCVGLSKNAFYTVQEKKDHIMWYKEYFESKKDILKEVGAWDMGTKPQSSEASK